MSGRTVQCWCIFSPSWLVNDLRHINKSSLDFSSLFALNFLGPTVFIEGNEYVRLWTDIYSVQKHNHYNIQAIGYMYISSSRAGAGLSGSYPRATALSQVQGVL